MNIPTVSLRTAIFIAAMVFLTLAAAVGVFADRVEQPNQVTRLENVREFAPAPTTDSVSFAVDSGRLFVGQAGRWQPRSLPSGVIPATVTVDAHNSETVYVGAANELAVYVSRDAGQSWLAVPLETQAIGGVTDLAFDAANRLLYVGTDTDGVHRLRDVGTSLIASGHLLLSEPVQEIAADSVGAGLAFVRTEWNLYRAEDLGLRWMTVTDLPSPATALAIADTTPPTVYVGTASSGVRMSRDGVTWQPVNQGLGYTPGSQLFISDLAVDPAQPGVLYAGTSLIFGSANATLSPIGVAMTTNGGTEWATLAEVRDAQIADLMPITGETGAVYALTTASRTPLALGTAADMLVATDLAVAGENSLNVTGLLAWALAGLAAAGLFGVVVMDLTRRRREDAEAAVAMEIAKVS